MKIYTIDNLDSFEKIKENWNSVYQADGHANFFLSWEWLFEWLSMVHEDWFILATKPENEEKFVSFFPLKLGLDFRDSSGLQSELCMAGNSIADYTGLLCLPGYEEKAVTSFSNYIKDQLKWSFFSLQSTLKTDPRMQLLLKNFSGNDFQLSRIRINNKDEDTNHYIAPYIALPNDWDQYLESSVSTNTRQKIRRFLRNVENSNELHIAETDTSNYQQHIDILLDLWQTKWREKKGDSCDAIVNYSREILGHCFRNDCLYLPVLWKGNKPLGAIACFVDARKKVYLFFMAGRDETCNTPPPGLILHAHAIRHAIQHGFKVYDFMKGNESYKYSFGAKERYIDHVMIETKVLQRPELDPRVLPLAFEEAVKRHKANQLQDAEQIYHQILDTQPNYSNAMYGLGALMAQKGEYQAAENLFKALLDIEPDSARGWFSLGNLYQSQGQFSEAVDAYRQALVLQPNLSAVYNNLGYALQQKDEWDAAISCYCKALELQPDCAEAEVNWANALHARGQLDIEKLPFYAQMNCDLGHQYHQVGDIKGASEYYRNALKMVPELVETDEQLRSVLQAQEEACAIR